MSRSCCGKLHPSESSTSVDEYADLNWINTSIELDEYAEGVFIQISNCRSTHRGCFLTVFGSQCYFTDRSVSPASRSDYEETVARFDYRGSVLLGFGCTHRGTR